jgi:hypothetical protein
MPLRSAVIQADPCILTHLLDGLLRDHSPVTHHHHAFDTEVLAQRLTCRHERRAVRGVALMHRHCHRAAPRIGEQPVVDLQGAALAHHGCSPVLPEDSNGPRSNSRTGRTAPGHHPADGVQPVSSEWSLARVQPVHGGVQIVLAGISHAELFGQGGGVPQRVVASLVEGHRMREATMAATRSRSGQGLDRQQRGKAQALHGQRHGLHVTMGRDEEISKASPAKAQRSRPQGAANDRSRHRAGGTGCPASRS